MLWDRFGNRWKWGGRALTLAAALSLAGCFRPMYGGATGQQLRQNLSAIHIEPIPARLGHYLASELRFALNGTGSEIEPKYRLHISINQKLQTPLIDTISGRATSGTVVIDARYRLIPVGAKEPVTQGVAFTNVSYDRSSQRFANLRAQRDAEIRAAKTLAEQIHVRLASALYK